MRGGWGIRCPGQVQSKGTLTGRDLRVPAPPVDELCTQYLVFFRREWWASVLVRYPHMQCQGEDQHRGLWLDDLLRHCPLWQPHQADSGFRELVVVRLLCMGHVVPPSSGGRDNTKEQQSLVVGFGCLHRIFVRMISVCMCAPLTNMDIFVSGDPHAGDWEGGWVDDVDNETYFPWKWWDTDAEGEALTLPQCARGQKVGQQQGCRACQEA